MTTIRPSDNVTSVSADSNVITRVTGSGEATLLSFSGVLKRPFNHLRTKLLVSMLGVLFLLTGAVLVLVQARMRSHVREDLVSSLRAESAVYANFEKARRDQTQQSAQMIAEQPTVKALMSTNDRLTVEDGSESILQTTHADLMMLENPNGELLAFHARSDDVPVPTLRYLVHDPAGEQDWWFGGGHLYDLSVAPIVAGIGPHQRELGRIVLGRDVEGLEVDAAILQKSPFIFERHGVVLLSSFPAPLWKELAGSLSSSDTTADEIREVHIGGERYLATSIELPGHHPVTLYLLLSFDQATSFLRALNRMLLMLGTAALLAGAGLAFLLSRQITRPLERLALGTRLLEKGDFEFQIPIQGSDEVADLTRAFDHMRNSLRQSRDGLLRSARLEAVGRLAGGVAHDFNNLVMIIKGYSELLLDTAPAESRSYLEEIKNAGERASALTRQLLAFSRKQVLEPQILDPNQTLRNMVKMLRVLIGEDIELVTNFSNQIGRVQADPGQLEQVVMNLAVNARDAMPDGGKLIIETQPCHLDESYAATHSEVTPGPFVQIAVTDTGCGMNAETLAHIFEPFFTTKAPGKGTGLGLATVYGIVKQSRGHISVYSEPGTGTTFKIYLPFMDRSIPVASAVQGAAAPKGDGTILLVEDEPALRVLAAESLRRLGYTVLQAGNGLEALALADQQPGTIDVLITDVVMPRMGGPELVEKIKQKRPDVAVIFMSGYTEAAALENAQFTAGAILVNKPFSTEHLARRVSEARQQAPEVRGKARSAGTSG